MVHDMFFESSGLLFRKLSLPDYLPGSLYLHPMPGRYEDINSFVSEIQKKNITRIICLPCPEEIEKISPEYMAMICNRTCPCPIVCFPIPDFGIPEEPTALLHLAEQCAERVKNGDNLLIHCRMGIGRTGIFSIMVLMASGVPLTQAEEIVRKAGAGAQTRPQRELLLWADSHLRK